MTEAQALKAAIERLGYASDDRPEECVTVRYGDGHSGRGWYAWNTDYPEEGAAFIGRDLPREFAKGAAMMGVTCLGVGLFAWHTADVGVAHGAWFAGGYAVAMLWAWSQAWMPESRR